MKQSAGCLSMPRGKAISGNLGKSHNINPVSGISKSIYANMTSKGVTPQVSGAGMLMN
eukprot:CAMPEP_0170458952 /NCGR_PEP_ID=MMETSP0123-20130129/5775_1 /TAXON_ID=182087 /ORGANISM="Favella ehrenbergii, Strain Fehren 1" /LENGTH=57 /DNA_ID=CAMNT_0010723321 /DNA_START=1385 /DNA_END=1558 /DNA_ORIENTATION=+